MSRPLSVLFAFVALSPGCIPVTEPLGDIEKAEPDKALLGTWKDSGGDRVIRIDLAPEVKGNPKGLMRITKPDKKPDEGMWFFVTTVDKQTYGNLCFDTEKKDKLDFRKASEYEQWAKGQNRAYYVFKYTAGKDEIITNPGNGKAFKAIAADAKITENRKTAGFETPPGWLAKYLGANGSGRLFPVAEDEKWVRVTK